LDKSKAHIVDIETYGNVFLCAVTRADGKHSAVLEVSSRKNEIERVFKLLDHIAETDSYLVTFNGIGFDYPILHDLYAKRSSLPKSGVALARKIFKIAQRQIDSFKGGQFGYTIKSEDCLVQQLDLYRIWHFNNKAKATSLKLLEFNMRMNDIQDLPYAIGQDLTNEEIDNLIEYNKHDIKATLDFFNLSQSQIDFRINLSNQYGKDWTNCDDTKIGAEYFMMRLEEAGIPLYKFVDGKRHMCQTPRKQINIGECLFDYYDFKRPEFIAVHEWFKKQVITETKGVFSDIEEHLLYDVAKYAELTIKRSKFKTKPSELELIDFKKEHPLGWVDVEELKATEYLFDADGNHVMEYPLDEDGSPDFGKKMKKVRVPKKSYWGCWKVAETLNVVVDGLRIDFGVGGIHASLSDTMVNETKSYQLIDADVSSMYPNIAISNRVFPAHLGEKFCDIYQDMYEQRKSFGKGTPENAMLKLALNGTYGKSNDKYSVFYDPKFTMTITINGELSLFMLLEKLLEVEGLKPVQLNTDGITVALKRNTIGQYNEICKAWEEQVKLNLEYADYSKMVILNVNNYFSVYTNGKVKRKGLFEYEGLELHKNHSFLVVQKAVEHELLGKGTVEEFILGHKDPFDFCGRAKVPRSSKLILVMDDGTEIMQQNICRYYACKDGGKLVKLMPALEGKEDDGDRRLGIDTEWNVKPCNNMLDFKWDVNYDYYISEAKKLTEPFKKEKP